MENADRFHLLAGLSQERTRSQPRVWVNRMWERFFGVGLVKTSENLGSQASYPTHPALLDWLAVDFMESGWDVKRFVKQLVTSRVYQQASAVSPEALMKDPENILFARTSRIRLPAEIVRDVALDTSGLLVKKSVAPACGHGCRMAFGMKQVNMETYVGTSLRRMKTDIVAVCIRFGNGRPAHRRCFCLMRQQGNMYSEAFADKYTITGTCSAK